MMPTNFYVLCKTLGDLCMAQHRQVALAESCTGGNVSAYITDLAGCSDWFNGSVIAYSNFAKINMLSVNENTLKQYGAVSEQTAKEMALGVAQTFKADLTVSITGIAGPNVGASTKPVGMVCFALVDSKCHVIEAKTQHFTSGREWIRRSASTFALEWMIEYLKTSER